MRMFDDPEAEEHLAFAKREVDRPGGALMDFAEPPPSSIEREPEDHKDWRREGRHDLLREESQD